VNESEVVERVHRYLLTALIDGERLSRLYTDPHPTLTSLSSLRPFQRFSVDFGDFAVHPDLLGQQAGSESLLAVEAKGDADLPWGIAQAEMYQRGVQRSFLAAPAAVLSSAIVDLARSKEVGVLSVSDVVEPLYVPEARRPLNAVYSALIADLGSVGWISESGTYVFNLPTHYLVWSTALLPRTQYSYDEARRAVAPFPIPKDWRAALRGAKKLGLITLDGGSISLTDVGGAVRNLMPSSIAEWAAQHERLTARGDDATLFDCNRNAASALQILLLQDPIVRLVLSGLNSLGPEGASFCDLADACSRLDKRGATIFFLKPESTYRWVQADGSVAWDRVDPSDYRSTTFFQYKSVLKHAGLLAPLRLGGASAHRYRPHEDIWRKR
jgi:hypothetical protein